MISGCERREAAEGLRTLCESHNEWNDYQDVVDDIETVIKCNFGQAHASQGLLLRLADLIDVPTCRADEFERAMPEPTPCGACGALPTVEARFFEAGWHAAAVCPQCRGAGTAAFGDTAAEALRCAVWQWNGRWQDGDD